MKGLLNSKKFRLIGAALGVVIVAVLFSATLQAAETWGATLFPVKRHDFGRVALGADAEYRFKFKNEYVEELRIISVNSSCGCTSVSAPKTSIKSAEEGEIVAKLNTGGQHTRDKSATLTVHLETVVNGKTLSDVVQLFVTGYIRPDVVLTPGIVEFGSVPEGKSVVRVVKLEYAGREDWALTKIERNNPFVHARAEETKRSGGEVAYKITVTLKPNAPVGYVKDTLRFSTNERKPGMNEAVEIVLPIQGVVTALIHAKPSPFMVGLVAPGENVVKSIVVRSEEPFRILDVQSTDKRFRFTFAEQKSNIQIVSVLFSSKGSTETDSAQLSEKIRIRTDLPDQEFVEIDALARITPKEESKSEPEKEDVHTIRMKDDILPDAVSDRSFSDLAVQGEVNDTKIRTIPVSTGKADRKAIFGTPKTLSRSRRTPVASPL